jgi:hypothetical protein
MLRKHRQMWDGHIGRVSATEHRIDLIPVAKPVHSQPYRSCPRVREIESYEVGRMLKAEVIEPASTEWASPVVIVPKTDEVYAVLRRLQEAESHENGRYIPSSEVNE